MKTLAIKQLLKYSEFTTEQVILNAVQSILNMHEAEHGMDQQEVVAHVLNKEIVHPKAFARQYLTARVSRDIYLMEDGKPMLKRYFIDSHLPDIILNRCEEIEEIGLVELRQLRGEIMEIYRENFK
jgi:hypothetical protein